MIVVIICLVIIVVIMSMCKSIVPLPQSPALVRSRLHPELPKCIYPWTDFQVDAKAAKTAAGIREGPTSSELVCGICFTGRCWVLRFSYCIWSRVWVPLGIRFAVGISTCFQVCGCQCRL